MAFGRRNRPSLWWMAARTAVVAGTATAASNARGTTQQELASNQTTDAIAPPFPPAAEDLLSKLERLAALHASGALTDAEFAALKATLIA